MKRDQLVKIRVARPEDENFIAVTWLKGLYNGNDAIVDESRRMGSIYREIDWRVYADGYRRILSGILSRDTTNVFVACLTEDDDVIVGYSVIENNRLHWVFVKQAWRKIGIANSLVPKEVTTVTHLTNIGRTIRAKRGYQFNPFLV
jgi:hypothetical protein